MEPCFSRRTVVDFGQNTDRSLKVQGVKSMSRFLKATSAVVLLSTGFIGPTWATKPSRDQADGGKCVAVPNGEPGLFSIPLKTIDGEATSLKQYKGRVMLIVNTASRCGYTSQYSELQSVFSKFKDKGFVVLGFPANDFGGQEPGTNKAIKEFCSVNFKVQFPMFQKASVVGKDQQPLFRYLVEKASAQEGLPSGEVKWNFEKFLVDRSGKIIGRFPSSVAPDSPKLLQAIETALLTNEGASCS